MLAGAFFGLFGEDFKISKEDLTVNSMNATVYDKDGNLIAELSKDKIILVSTHVVSDIESIAKKIILIKTGKIIDYANVNGLCDKYNATNLEDVYMKIFGEE